MLRPSGPTIAGKPLWWALPALGGALAAAGLLVGLLAAGRDDDGDAMLGGLLLGTDLPAILVAGASALVLGLGLLAADAGLVSRDALVFGVLAPDWALYGLASLVSFFFVGLGLSAWAWSRGRGSRARKASAARNHLVAALLALIPWGIRAFFGA